MTDTAEKILHNAYGELKNVGSSPILDVRILLEKALGVSREELLKNSKQQFEEKEIKRFECFIERRRKGEPVAKIIGEREFWGLTFKTNKHTLDPRPDSETLIEAVLREYKDKTQKLRIVDLGTGTGCLLLSLLSEYKNASGAGVDISEKALKTAKENAENLSLDDRAEFVISNWAEDITDKFDIVISNPPYIKSGEIKKLEREVAEYDPISALDGGNDGLNCYRAIAGQVNNLLKKGGKAFFEIGEGQEGDIKSIIPLEYVNSRKDLAGIIRCLVFRA